MRIEQILYQKTTGEKEIDFYVPIKINFKGNDNRDKELFYYRMFNPKSSFIEMSINPVTNKIVNITLVSVNDIEDIEDEIECFNIAKEAGNPIIDMKIFNDEHIVTDNVNFKVIRHGKSIYILQQHTKVHRRLSMDNVDLLLNEQNSIVGFVFGEFSAEEWKEINESIDSSVSVALEGQSV